MARETSCGALVLYNDNNNKKILLIKNKGSEYWGFPKGHLENGETHEETALREIFEETGLKVRLINDFRTKTTYSKQNGNTKDVIYFIAETDNPDVKIQEKEIADFKWLGFRDCLQTLTHMRDREVLKEAEIYIN